MYKPGRFQDNSILRYNLEKEDEIYWNHREGLMFI